MTPPRSRARAGGNLGAGATNGPSLNETAYRAIKADIIACVLQPGEEISEAVLVGRYGFSKAPIRSALMRLRQEGLIVSRGRQGNIVSPVTLRDVKEVFQLRLLLEAKQEHDLARIENLFPMRLLQNVLQSHTRVIHRA